MKSLKSKRKKLLRILFYYISRYNWTIHENLFTETSPDSTIFTFARIQKCLT